MTVVPIEGGALPARRMSAATIKAQAEEIRELQRAALTEGIDYGRIPNTPKPTLYQPGAQWLLKWAGLGHRQIQGQVERDKDGRPYGVTYTCSIHLLDGSESVVATADGYCGYDESDREEHTSKFGKLIPRSPWNTIVKMAQKRALVAAALAATAASGIFTQDVEDTSPAVDPEEEFRRLGWSGKEEADAARTAQMRAIKEHKLTEAFGTWRAEQKVPAFVDGWHTKHEADKIGAWLKIVEAEAKLAAATAGEATESPEDAPEKPARATRGKKAPEPEATPETASEPAPGCQHNWFEEDDGTLVCPECGEVQDR